jgi:ferredoxin
MNVSAASLVYFSPTRTTKTVLEGIASGLMPSALEHIDLTPPDALRRPCAPPRHALALIGAPVYAGRIPPDMRARFRRLKGNGALAVVVVVYGNRAYEDALLELRDMATDAGFRPIAAGAFIGEHSYSQKSTPIALGRPDAEDLAKAMAFGRQIRSKVESLSPADAAIPIPVPGNFPYKESGSPSAIAPDRDMALCAGCGLCIPACPTAAISLREAMHTEAALCIRCCACVRACPTGALQLNAPKIMQFREYLTANCGARREPETYLGRNVAAE